MNRTILALCTLSVLLGAGCDMAKLAAGSTIKVFARAAPGIQRYRDADLAEAAMPASISQMEGVMVLKPEDETLRALLSRTYGSYGYGFLEEHMEQAAEHEDQDAVEYFRGRASLAYARGKEVAFEMMTVWEDDDGGAQGAYSRGIEAWKRYLQKFDDEDQAPVLFWCAYNWARYVGVNRSDVNAVADLEFVRELSNRALALDRSYYQFAPLALHAGLLATIPAAVGGQPEVAKTEFEEVIRQTHRHNLIYLVNEAQLVAVALQDRALYRSLLEEVIAAGDVDPDLRLPNIIAKRRAARYLARINDLFEPVAGEEPAAQPQTDCDAPRANESFEDFDRRCSVSGGAAAPAAAEPTPAQQAAPAAEPAPAPAAEPAAPASPPARPRRAPRPAAQPASGAH